MQFGIREKSKVSDHRILGDGSLFNSFWEKWMSWAERAGILGGAEVARYLGVTNSCVTRAVSGGEVLDRDKYL